MVVIGLIKKKVSLGATLQVVLKTGQEMQGVLAEISDDYIMLQSNTGEAYLTDESISAWKIVSNEQRNTSIPSISFTETIPVQTEPIEQKEITQLANPVIPPVPVDIFRKEISIIESFKAASRNLIFECFPPVFIFSLEGETTISYKQKEEFRKELEKYKNRYEYALKIKEYSRFNQIAFELSELMKKNPASGRGWYCLGSLYSQMGKDFDAAHAYELAIAYSADSEPCYNLFVTYFKRKEYAREFNALNVLFSRTSPSKYKLAWYRFVDLVSYYFSVDKLIEVLKRISQSGDSTEIVLLLESISYFFLSSEKTDEGRAVISLLNQSEISKNDFELIEQLLAKLKQNTATIVYKRQQRELEESEQQLNAIQSEAIKQKRISELLATAENLARQGGYLNAISELDKVIQLDPGNIDAKHRRQKYLEISTPRTVIKSPIKVPSTKKYNGPLPTGGGYYAKAKRAQLADGDLEKAAELLKLAIDQGDNAESAVKDLASVYQQLGKAKDGIELLSNYLDRANDRLKILNMLGTMYIGAGLYKDAVSVFLKILNIVPKADRAKVHKQIGFCYFKANDFENATVNLRQVLNLTPKDDTAQKWLDALQQAKRTGTYNQLEKIFGDQDLLSELTSSISKFLEFYLERCSYEGVQDAKIANKNFSEEDLNKLRGLIEGAGRARPGLRAQYSLSSAKLLMDLEAGDERRFRQYLQQYTIDMGNASLAEQKPREVAIAFYLEGFALSSEINNSRLRETLSKIMMLVNVKDTELILAEKLPSFSDSIRQALKVNSKAVTEFLLELTSINNGVKGIVLTEILRDESIANVVWGICCDLLGESQNNYSDPQDFIKLWGRGIDYIRQSNNRVEDDITYLMSLPLLDTMPEQEKRILALAENSRGILDRERLKKIAEVLQHVYDYVQQQSYVERERLATIIKNRVNDLVDEIENRPTKSSLELYWSYLYFIQKSIEEHFSIVQQATEPDKLECALSIESYIPDKDDNITCQITVSNQNGKSPASSLSIQLLNSPNGEYYSIEQNHLVSEALPGGKATTCQIPIKVTEKARSAKVFTLYYNVSFSTRMGKRIDMLNQILPVRLYPGSHFEIVHNPYATYAEGGPVEDKSMFFGRGPLIDRLKSTIENSSNNKSLVIYGQKRTGKSSVIYHLNKELDPHKFIPVNFSIGEIIQEFSFANFLYKIFQSLFEALDDLSLEGYPEVAIERPSLDELSKSPQLVFHEYFQKITKTLSKVPDYNKAKILLLIDEFSYVYTEIKEGRVPDTFMKSWKAMLEKGYFGSVLVGQDIMRQFIERYPNEFQVAQSERVSYLDADDAKKLMVEPIRILDTGESRYRGVALERLLSLTAGNPYYVQIFCSQLVRYMNDKRAIYITDADIERVKEQLISGNNHLTIDKFDNLINGGDRGVDAIPDDDTLAILRCIALGSRTQQYCYRSAITADTSISQDTVLNDLIRREVVEKQGASNYRIRVELFKEWLLVHQ